MGSVKTKAAQDTRCTATARLAQVRIVLINTTHPGNIGATARAMKVMGLSRLELVSPSLFPSAEATALASGAADLLQKAGVHESLESALAGCSLVLGTSARLRSLSMPQLDVRNAAAVTLKESERGEIAILFGREAWGLTNEEIQRCHQLVHIDTNPEFGSLNLAQAVQVVAYELRMAALAEESGAGSPVQALAPLDWEPVDAGQMEHFYVHLEQTLRELEFLNPRQPRRLMMRLRRLFNRARPDQNEINILRGILSAAQRAVAGSPGTPEPDPQAELQDDPQPDPRPNPQRQPS